MNIKLIAAAVVAFSAFVFAFSPARQKAENPDVPVETAKCAISSFENAFRNSAEVFLGEVTSETKEGDERTFVFEVERYWKGAGAKKIEIRVYETARYQAWFKKGETYLIYAARDTDDNHLRVGRCSRSREEGYASEDLKKLGAGKRPE